MQPKPHLLTVALMMIVAGGIATGCQRQESPPPPPVAAVDTDTVFIDRDRQARAQADGEDVSGAGNAAPAQDRSGRTRSSLDTLAGDTLADEGSELEEEPEPAPLPNRVQAILRESRQAEFTAGERLQEGRLLDAARYATRARDLVSEALRAARVSSSTAAAARARLANANLHLSTLTAAARAGNPLRAKSAFKQFQEALRAVEERLGATT